VSTRFNRLIPWVAVGIVAILTVGVVARTLMSGTARAKPTVATATSSERRIAAAGIVSGVRDSNVYPALQGTVERVLVKDQQLVKAGTPLVELDDRPYLVARAQALAAMRQAEAAQSSLANQRPTQSALSAARSAIRAASGQRSVTRRNLRDALDGMASVTVVRGLKAEVASTEAACEQALATRDALRNASDTSDQREAIAASLKAAQQARANAERDLEDTVVRAPFTGTVLLATGESGQGQSAKLVRGQGVTPQAPLLRIVDTSALKFVADVDPDDISQVRTGQNAVVSVDAVRGREFSGTTTFVALVSKTTRSGVTAFNVECSLPSGAQALRVGMAGIAQISLSQAASAIRIPQSAVTRRDGAAVVFVVSNGVARLRRVALGSSTGSDYEITSGLVSGESVATSGLAQLQDGARVSAE